MSAEASNSIAAAPKFVNIRSWPLFVRGQFQYVGQVSTLEGMPFLSIGRFWRPNNQLEFIPTKKNICLPVEAVFKLQNYLPEINSLLFTLSTPFMQAKAIEQSGSSGNGSGITIHISFLILIDIHISFVYYVEKHESKPGKYSSTTTGPSQFALPPFTGRRRGRPPKHYFNQYSFIPERKLPKSDKAESFGKESSENEKETSSPSSFATTSCIGGYTPPSLCRQNAMLGATRRFLPNPTNYSKPMFEPNLEQTANNPTRIPIESMDEPTSSNKPGSDYRTNV